MDTKPIWQSKTFWGAIITLASSAVLLFGVEVSAEEQEAIGNSVMQIVGGVVAVIGTITAIYGRYKAEKRIG